MSNNAAPPLEPTLFSPDFEEKGFIKAMTGIHSEEHLKAHIHSVQNKAYDIYPHPYVRNFEFTWLQMSRLPVYIELLRLGRERPNAILLDLGCCLGGDVRRAVIDGYPAQNIIATDVQQALWDLGHEFYRSTHASFPVRFVAGDAFDPAFLALTPILPTNPALPTALTYPANITALTQLHGRASAVHAGSFFHLFPFAHQELLARLLAGLLSPLPGSFLFGAQAGRPTRTAAWCPAPGAIPALDCHSPDSWRALWERVFAEAGVRVEVRAHLRTESRGGRGYAGTAAAGVAAQPQPYHVLEWSVTRL